MLLESSADDALSFARARLFALRGQHFTLLLTAIDFNKSKHHIRWIPDLSTLTGDFEILRVKLDGKLLGFFFRYLPFIHQIGFRSNNSLAIK